MSIEKILVVDDELIVRQLFKRILGKNYEVTVAESGEDALEKFKQQKFDIAFIDVVMPGMDGIATLKAIKEIDSKTPCVIITGFAVDEKIKEALLLNAIDYIYKPFGAKEIEAVLTKIEKHKKLKPLN